MTYWLHLLVHPSDLEWLVNTEVMKMILVILFFPLAVCGQLSISVVENDLVVEPENQLLTYYPLGDFKPLEWQTGTAYYPNGSSKNFQGIRFNLPEDRAEVNANGTILPLLPGIVTGVSMGEEDKINHIFINVPLETPVFMELLVAGKVDFLVYRKIKDDEIVDLGGSRNSVRFDKEEEVLEYKEQLYIWNNGVVEPYKPSKGFLLKIMADHSEEMEAYMKKNKPKLKNPQSAAVLIDYYNHLK